MAGSGTCMTVSGLDVSDERAPGKAPARRVHALRDRLTRPVRGDGLRARAIRGAGWTLAGFGMQQVLRLGSSLVLTRLLFPEAYGLMAIANVYMTGLSMFSDVGLRQSIIQNPRGQEPEFLNTVWTMQVIRGFILWAVSCIIAYPVSRFYEAPILFPILCVLGMTAAIRGFQTTAYFTANRNLHLGRVTALEVISQFIGILIIVGWASVHSSVWALAGGGTAASLVTVALGHFALPSHRHQFHWDRSSAADIFGFGKWIFFATILGYLANNGDKLILGKFMSTELFGMYALALTWAGLVSNINSKIGERVLVPLYAIKRDASSEEMRPKIRKLRLAKASMAFPATSVLVIFGPDLISLMYDDRYQGAGWMLRVLAIGIGFHAVMNIGDFMLSRGKSRLFFATVCMAVVTSLGSMTVGGLIAGETGIVIGVAAIPVLTHLWMIPIYIKHGYWLWRLDAAFLLVLAVMTAIAFGLR